MSLIEIVIITVGVLVMTGAVLAGPLDVGQVTDARLGARRGTDTRFELAKYASLEQWQGHATRLREQILTGCGLNPMPKKTPLRARIFGNVDRGDYTVETVTFQSYPGLYVIGNLYRPKGKQGKLPVILSPHGHGKDGRFEDEDLISVPARCANLAKLGMIAFAYSMMGFNEATQIGHGFKPSPRQELWGISPGGLQLWNSIRAVDFVSTLPDVDTKRIGCTGESGGGTQTFMLSAVDDRIAVNAPVCMISAIMQGGCQCENAPLVRIDSNSVEIGCLMAPKPMMMVGATGDWTKETRESEYPTTREIYKLYGAQSKLGMYFQDAGHNYNKGSREHVYPWFQKWFLGENVGDVTPEQPHNVGDTKLLTAWNEPPQDALNLDGLTNELIEMDKAQIEGFGLGSRSSLDRYRRTFGPALRRCFAVSVPKAAEITAEDRGSVENGDYSVTKLVIGRKGVGDAIPALYFEPKQGKKSAPVLLVHPEGKSALLDGDEPGDEIKTVLANGKPVLAIDCFLTGDADKHDERVKEKFFTSFYRTDAAERVQDIVTALCYLKSRGAANADLVGLGASGLDCLFARAFAGGSGTAIIDADQFDTTDDQAFVDKLFVPSIRRAGDVRTASAMIAPGKLTICNAGKGFPSEWVKRAYEAAGSEKNVRITSSALSLHEIVGKL